MLLDGGESKGFVCRFSDRFGARRSIGTYGTGHRDHAGRRFAMALGFGAFLGTVQ